MVKFTRSSSTILLLLVTGCSEGSGALSATPSLVTQDVSRQSVASQTVTGQAAGVLALAAQTSAAQATTAQAVAAQAQAVLAQSTLGQARELVYISNEDANSITAYATTASGNAHPVLTIAGSKTKLDQPVGLTFDSSGKLYVVNHGLSQSSVTIYAQSSSGNVAPIGTIEGSQTHLRAQLSPADYPTGAIAVDSVTGRIFVGRVSGEQSPFPNNILVFNLSARGNAAPISSIGAADETTTRTGLSGMEPAPAVAFDGIGSAPKIIAGTELEACCHTSDGWTYYNGSNLTPGGSLNYYTNSGLYGIAVTPSSGNIVASYGGEIDVWPADITGNAGGPSAGVLPSRVITGAQTGYGQIAVDSKKTIWALVRGSGSTLPQSTGAAEIDVYGPNATIPVVISGPATGLAGTSGIAILR